MRDFEAWGQTDVTFGQLDSATFGTLDDSGVTLDGGASPATQDALAVGAPIAVTYNAATVTHATDTVTYGYTDVPTIAALNQQASSTRQDALSAAILFTSYDTLLTDLDAAAQTASTDREPGHVTRTVQRAYQQTLHMQTEGRPLTDWIRIAGALVVTAAVRDADRARAADRMAAQRDMHARAWAANALEEAGA